MVTLGQDHLAIYAETLPPAVLRALESITVEDCVVFW